MREVMVSCRKNEKKTIADFHVLGLFMAKIHDLNEKKNPYVTRCGRCRRRRR
jgi:hypothetical protein